jgi:hypothetical protein
MLPPGHIAAGVLVGAERSRHSGRHPGAVIAGGIVATCLPDLDLIIPALLDRLGVHHGLSSGEHHSWATHTPLFWGLVAVGARGIARRSSAPGWAAEASSLLSAGVAVHLLQDSVANTVALLWPWRRGEYGLGLDHLVGVTDHIEYARRYPFTPAGKLEGALVLTALFVGGRRLVPAAHR